MLGIHKAAFARRKNHRRHRSCKRRHRRCQACMQIGRSRRDRTKVRPGGQRWRDRIVLAVIPVEMLPVLEVVEVFGVVCAQRPAGTTLLRVTSQVPGPAKACGPSEKGSTLSRDGEPHPSPDPNNSSAASMQQHFPLRWRGLRSLPRRSPRRPFFGGDSL